MTEVISIYLQFLIFFIIFQYPINKSILNNCSKLKFNFFEIITLNIILHLFFYLILSFLSINLKVFFILEIFFGLSFIIFNIVNLFKKNTLAVDDNFILIIIFVIFNIILFTQIAGHMRLEWDGLAHWIYKAQIYFQEGTFADIKHVDFSYYPQLGSFLWGYFWKNSFLELEYFGRLIFPFLYLVGIFLSVSSLNNNKNLLIKIIIIIVLITLSLDFYLFGGYQEYLLFFELLVFSKFFDLYRKNRSNLLFVILFLDTVLILWTKQEGFFYNIILTIVFVVFCDQKNKIKALFSILVFLSIFLQIELKNNIIGNFEFNEPIIHNGLLRYLQISEIISTFLLISKNIIISFFRYPIWILILFIVSYSQLFNQVKMETYTKFYLLIYFIFVYAIYFQTQMNLEYLLPITIDRILLHGSGFMIYPVVILLNNIMLKIK
jgi:hypothetical protein